MILAGGYGLTFTQAGVNKREHEQAISLLSARVAEAQALAERLLLRAGEQITVPLNQGKLGVSLTPDAVVTSTKGVSASAGLPVGSRVLSVDGVPVSTKVETVGHVQRLTAAGAASLVMTVQLSPTPGPTSTGSLKERLKAAAVNMTPHDM